MSNAFVQVPPNSTGLKMQTFENVVGANTVESEAVTLVRSSDNTEVGTAAQALRVDPVGTTTQPVSGTVAVSNFPVTQTIAGGLTNNNAAPAATQIGVLSALANAANPTWTEGDQVLLSADLSGHQRVVATGTAATGVAPAGNPVQIAGVDAGALIRPIQLVNISGTTGAIVNGQSVAGADAVNNGNGGGLIAGNGSGIPINIWNNVFNGTTWDRQRSGTATGSVLVNNPTAANLNATVTGTVTTTPPANASTNLAQWAGTTLGTPTNFGTTPTAVVAGSVNASLFVGTTAITAAATGVPRVGISGTNAATMDAVVTAATAPANGLATLLVNNTTAPSLTTGQSVAAQCDYEGSLFVKPYRRAQTVSQATTIAASSAATTILAAQAAGIFADISNFIVTVTPAATADLSFTVTLSDGTKSYIFDMDTGALATATADPTIINIAFNPPLPASTAAVAWTQTNSVSTGVTTHTTVVAVLQKAS